MDVRSLERNLDCLEAIDFYSEYEDEHTDDIDFNDTTDKNTVLD